MGDDSRPKPNSIERLLVNNPKLRDLARKNRKEYEADAESLERWASTGFKAVSFADEAMPLTFEGSEL
mgnify:CR=1 FL=1